MQPQTGLLTVFCQHTSASLVIQENADPDVVADLADFLTRLVPEDTRLYRHTAEGPDDMTSHIRSALTQTQLIDSDPQWQAGAGDLAGRLSVRASRAAASAQRGAAFDQRLRSMRVSRRRRQLRSGGERAASATGAFHRTSWIASFR